MARLLGEIALGVAIPLLLILGLAGGLALDAESGGLVSRWELATYDWRMRWRGTRPPSPEILVVYVDDESVTRLGLRGTTPSREMFGRAIDRALESGATVVGLDYVFEVADPVASADDRAFVEALQRADGWVVLAGYIARGGRWQLPAPAFAQPEGGTPLGVGMINVIPDVDGRLRRPRDLFYVDQLWKRGFALEVFWLHRDIRAEAIEGTGGQLHFVDPAQPGANKPEPVRYDIPGGRLVDFPGPARHFDHEPFWRLVEGKVDPSRLKGRAVLIGDATTTRGGSDFVVTPFTTLRPQLDAETGFAVFSEDSFPGIDFHAACLQGLIEQRAIFRVPPRPVLGLAALAAFVLAWLGWRGRASIWLLLAVWVAGSGLLLGAAWREFVANQRWLDVVAPGMLWVIAASVAAGAFVVRLLRQRSQISQLFGRYVSANYVQLLVDRVREGESIEGLLVGRRQEVSVLFSDVRGFTTLSEKLAPERIALILKRYFNAMTRIVREDYSGTMDKLLGDGLMAFYNAPLDQPDHALKAGLTALAMVRALDAMAMSDLAEDLPLTDETRLRLSGPSPLAIGIGINTGPAIVGDLGSDTFANYTVLGDTVNLASRLEGLTKEYQVRIVLGDRTRSLVEDQLLCRRIDQVLVKGRSQPVWVHELLARRDEATPEQYELATTYEAAVAALTEGRQEEARARFAELATRFPTDRPTQILSERLAVRSSP